MEIKDILIDLQIELDSKRYEHTLSTADMANKLANYLGYDENKAYIAGILHDCAKCLPKEKMFSEVEKYNIKLDKITQNATQLIHAPLGALYAKMKYGVNDESILSAIKYHTTGKVNMSTLDKIIFLADMIEQTRNYDEVDILRKKAFSNFDEALIMGFDSTINHVVSSGGLLHTDTVEARNYLLLDRKCR